jgi:hypothetical protein
MAAIEYPAYMTTKHEHWLGEIDTAIGTAVTGNPFTGRVAYDPATPITNMNTALSSLTSVIAAIDPATIYGGLYSSAVTIADTYVDPDTYIVARAAAHGVGLDAELISKVYPRFEAGMRDINSVMTSAFAIGRAIIEMDRNDKYDKFLADMFYQADAKRTDTVANIVAEMNRLYLQKAEYERVKAALAIDIARITIAAYTDQKIEDKTISSDGAKWPLEMYKYGQNMLAGISGGVAGSVATDGNKTARIIGTGLSGAVAGAMVGAMVGGDSGSGYGALIGGIAGALGGAG